MDSKHLDRFARFLAKGTDRRGALRVMAAGAAGGATLAHAASHAAAQATPAAGDAPGAAWVQLYEEMAAAADAITGECAAVSDALQGFQEANADLIAQMQAEIASWSAEQIQAHQQAHGARVQQASIRLNLAMTRCGYLPGSDSPHSLADTGAVFGEPGPAPGVTPATSPVAHRKAALPEAQISSSCWFTPNDLRAYCECTCTHDFTVGNCILWGLGCAFGGCTAGPNCCWSGICVAGYDHPTCVNQCINCAGVGVSC